MSDAGGDSGLYEKYEVYKDGEQQSGCFVLKPASDSAARAALRTYATETENEELADDIDELLARLEAMEETRDRYVR